MKTAKPRLARKDCLQTELLIMPDGQILVHNLTQPFAELLHELNPDCEQITSRITHPPLLRSGAASHPSPKP
jgi:hypothetical protein